MIDLNEIIQSNIEILDKRILELKAELKDCENKRRNLQKSIIKSKSVKRTVEQNTFKNLEKTLNSIKATLTEENKEFLKTISIKAVFTDSVYNRFLKYCLVDRIIHNEKAIETMYDLLTFNFKEFYDVKGVGKSKSNSVLEKYIYALNHINELSPISESNNKVLFLNINEKLLNIPIEYLSIFGVKAKTINLLKSNALNRVQIIGDLQGITKVDLSNILTRTRVAYLINIESNLNTSIIELLFEYLAEIVKTKDYEIYKLRKSNKTLQEISEVYNLTRERIRQITEKVDNQVNIALLPIITDILSTNGYFDKNILVDYLRTEKSLSEINEYLYIMLTSLKENSTIEYLDFANIYVKNDDKDNIHIYNNIVDIVKSVLDTNASELYIPKDIRPILRKLWNNNYTYLKNNDIINLFIDLGYTQVGAYLYKNQPSQAILCCKLVEEVFHNGFKKNEHDVNILKKEFLNQYGFELNGNTKAIYNGLDKSLILYNKGTLISPSKIDIDESLLIEIKNYIDNSSDTEFYYMDLYDKFKYKLSQLSNIDNYHFLHGVIKYYYPNDFDYYKRDKFRKFK